MAGAWSSALTSLSRLDYYGCEFEIDPTKPAVSASRFDILSHKDNPHYANFSPVEHAPEAVFEKLEFSSRLIRLDMWNKMHGKCVFLNDFEEYNESTEASCADFLSHTYVNPTALNESGAIARELCRHKRYNYMMPELKVEMGPMFETLNQEQLEWLKNPVNRNENLDKEKKEFDYGFVSMKFEINVSLGDDECCGGTFESLDDLLLFCEGLDWK